MEESILRWAPFRSCKATCWLSIVHSGRNFDRCELTLICDDMASSAEFLNRDAGMAWEQQHIPVLIPHAGGWL